MDHDKKTNTTIPDSLSSRKSSESSENQSAESDEFVVVGVANNTLTLPTTPVLAYVVSENDLQDAISVSTGNMRNSPSTPLNVGKSIFYDCDENLSFQKSDTDDGMNHNHCITLKPIETNFAFFQMLRLMRSTKITKTMEISQSSLTCCISGLQTFNFRNQNQKFSNKSTK